MSRVVQALLLVLGLAVTAIGVAEAGEREHTVAPGESASAIAKKYYGNFDLTPLLLAYNGREGTLLQPGETLRIPYCEVHRVQRGEYNIDARIIAMRIFRQVAPPVPCTGLPRE